MGKYCGKIVSRIVIDVGLKSAMDFQGTLGGLIFARINFCEELFSWICFKP